MSIAMIEPSTVRPVPAGVLAGEPPAEVPAAAESIRNVSDIRAQQAIVHIVDHRKGNSPVLSAAELPLQDEEKLRRYFEEQIENILADPETGDALFAEPGEVAASCRRILNDPGVFVEESQRIAQALWMATGTDLRISPGSLIVCRFLAGADDTPFLALLKIDPTDVLLQKISHVDGRLVVSLRVAENALPTARERLQKAAVVAPRGYARNADLLLLDRLVARPAAEFFAQKFLNAQPVLTRRDRTEAFYLGYIKARNLLTGPDRPAEIPALTPEAADYLDDEVKHVLQRRSVDVSAWGGELDLPDKIREVLVSTICAQLDTRELEIDPAFATDKLVKTRRIRGDHKILIEFDRQVERLIFHAGEPYRNAAGVQITPVTMDVPNLRWIR